MKAAILTKPYQIQIQDVEKPVMQDRDVLIRVVFTGVCGSELHAFQGTHTLRTPPVILGHEISGEIVKIGSNVSKFVCGDRVTVFPLLGCGECANCLEGSINLCDKKVVLGTKQWQGSFAEYISVPEQAVYPLFDKVSLEAGAVIEPLAVAVHAVRKAGVTVGDKVLIMGGGTIGLCILLVTRQAGAFITIVTDVVEYNRKKALELGVTYSIDGKDEYLIPKCIEFTDGKGCDKTFITASASHLVNQAIQLTRKKGTIMVLSTYEDSVPLDIQKARSREQIVTGTTMYNHEDFRRAIDLVAANIIDVSPLITKVLKLSDAQYSLELLQDRTENFIKILLSTT